MLFTEVQEESRRAECELDAGQAARVRPWKWGQARDLELRGLWQMRVEMGWGGSVCTNIIKATVLVHRASYPWILATDILIA